MTFVQRSWRLAIAVGLIAVAGAVAVPTLAANADVSIVDRSFEPATITVAAGDTVTWTVTKAIGEPHSVTSGTPGPDQGKEFDSAIGLQENGLTFQHTFTTPGTYAYFCQVHSTVMTGEVIVTAAGSSAAPPSEAPPASGPPASEGPAASPAGSPGASAAPTAPPVSPEAGEPLPPEVKPIAAGILIVALVLLFGANWYWRRLNPG